MKNILTLFTNVNMCLIRKLVACAVLLCITLGSIEFVPAKYDFSFLKNISVSADTSVNHLFSLATSTMDVVSKLFTQAQDIENASKAKNENKTNQEKTSKEASSFSILPADISFSSSLNRSINKVKDISVAVTENIYTIPVLFEDFSKVCKEFILLNIMLFMLMMFLIKKNTSSDNYGNIKINNIGLAWLVV